MFNVKFKKKSHKMGFKALPVKIQQSQGAVRVEGTEAICVEIVTGTKNALS